MNRTTLPTEILCEIFLPLCEKPIALHALENKTCFDGFPWAVGRVCKHWRQAFISYPRLWTNISLEYIYDHTLANAESPIHPDLDKFVEIDRRTAIYLKRSGQLPLTISVSITASSGIKRVAHFPRNAWESLLACSSRWKKAELVIGNAPDIVGDLLECRNRIRALESVDLTVSCLVHRSRAHGSAFVAAPHLTELTLKHHGANSMWAFPWSQLKKLDLEMSRASRYPRAKLEAILSQMHNLEELRFFPINSRYVDFSPSAPVRLPSLRFLEISLDSYHPYMFKWFRTPSLEHLWLKCSTYNYGYSADDWKVAISSFLKRSSCLICRRLTLQNCYIQFGHMIMEALGASIERLCVKGPDPSQLVQDIAKFEDNTYLPNLRELQVVCCSGGVTGGFMSAMSLLLQARGKASRSALVVSLEKVTLELGWGKNCECYGKRCRKVTDKLFARKLDNILETMRNCSSVTDISVDRTHAQICTITLLVAGREDCQ